MSDDEMPDDPPDQYEDLYDNPLNAAVYFEYMDAGPNLADKLIALMESSEPITGHVSGVVAEMLKAGLNAKSDDALPSRVGDVQLRVVNAGQRKKSLRSHRISTRRKSILRAKAFLKLRDESTAPTVEGALANLEERGAKTPASERTIGEDLRLHKLMLRWIANDGYPPLWKHLYKSLDEWRALEIAETDFIEYGPDLPAPKKRKKTGN